jgi:serine O-acetyltransferase
MDKITICNFVARQLGTFFPGMSELKKDVTQIGRVISLALQKYAYCANHIRIFRGETAVDPLHIMKYPIFLLILSREVHLQLEDDNSRLKDRIHALNKSLHGCSISYKIEMPPVFFLNYATNIVLANTNYGNNLVLYHGVTVGAYRDKIPTIGCNVVLMPNVIVSGDSKIGDNVVISTGVRILNRIVPSDSLVYDAENGELFFVKRDTRGYINSYLRI